jgi:hypothetical protein
VSDAPAALLAAIDELDRSIGELERSVQQDGVGGAGQAAILVVAAIRKVNDILPSKSKPPKGAFRSLQRHAKFVEIYLGRGNEAYVRSNSASLSNDIIHLRAELAPMLQPAADTLGINVEELREGPEKQSLRESVKNYCAGAFGSAIASAVNALEGYFRRRRLEFMNVEFSKGTLFDVMRELETNGHLTKAEAPLSHIVRLYRNCCDHPSEFVATSDDAKMTIQFVFNKLKFRRQGLTSTPRTATPPAEAPSESPLLARSGDTRVP